MANEDDDLPTYPSGQVSISPGGRMRQVTDITVRESNGSKLTHSLAASPAGTVDGVNDCSGSYTMEIPKGGIERPEFLDVKNAKGKAARLEIPGNALTYKIKITDREIRVATGDSVKITFNFIGKNTSITKLPTT